MFLLTAKSCVDDIEASAGRYPLSLAEAVLQSDVSRSCAWFGGAVPRDGRRRKPSGARRSGGNLTGKAR